MFIHIIRRDIARNIIGTILPRTDKGHWVGDGFPVSQMFSHSNHGKHLNPFILLDRAGPAVDFPPSEGANGRGVGDWITHRGFQTVTIVYDGEVAHHDSTGQGGVIGKGDVQWMTAASGILHQEYHSDRFMRKAARWIWCSQGESACFRKIRRTGLSVTENNAIPVVALPNDAGTLRVIAENMPGRGPARTFTEMDVWDLRLKAGKVTGLAAKASRNAGLIVLHGSIYVDSRAPGCTPAS